MIRCGLVLQNYTEFFLTNTERTQIQHTERNIKMALYTVKPQSINIAENLIPNENGRWYVYITDTDTIKQLKGNMVKAATSFDWPALPDFQTDAVLTNNQIVKYNNKHYQIQLKTAWRPSELYKLHMVPLPHLDNKTDLERVYTKTDAAVAVCPYCGKHIEFDKKLMLKFQNQSTVAYECKQCHSIMKIEQSSIHKKAIQQMHKYNGYDTCQTIIMPIDKFGKLLIHATKDFGKVTANTAETADESIDLDIIFNDEHKTREKHTNKRNFILQCLARELKVDMINDVIHYFDKIQLEHKILLLCYTTLKFESEDSENAVSDNNDIPSDYPNHFSL